MRGKAGVLAYFTVAGLALGASMGLAGCQKQAPAVPVKTAAEAPGAAQVAVQTACPVMGGAIDKSIFVEYKGKKVYFCCQSCVETFNADPEKYLAKLPQSAK